MKLKILVTRQMPQGKQLAEGINALGWAQAILCPLLEISPITNSKDLAVVLDNINNYDLAICTSMHAVTAVMPYIQQHYQYQRRQPSSHQQEQEEQSIDQLSWAAVGESTALALSQYGVEQIVAPPQKPFNSEGLLQALDNFKFNRRAVLVFKGKGDHDRELLVDSLRARQLAVTCITCYQRNTPPNAHIDLKHAVNSSIIDCILVTCETILYTLSSIADLALKSKLQASTLVVASPRIRDTALNLGWTKIHLAAGASNNDMLAAITTVYATHYDN